MIETVVIPLSEFVEIVMRFKRVRKTATANFAVIGRIRENADCKEIIRIDNYLHRNKAGTHVHFFDKEKRKDGEQVEYLSEITTPWEASQYVEKYLRNFYPDLL